MKIRAHALLLVPMILLAAACTLPNLTAPSAASTPAVFGASTESFSVATDESRGVVVLTGPQGVTVDITAVDADGTTADCVAADAVTPLADDDSSRGAGSWRALVIGTRGDGKPGAWIVSSDKTVEPLLSDDTGQLTTSLPETDEKGGTFRARWGWTYQVKGVSEDGKLVAGIAVNVKGYTAGFLTVAPGTSLGVYWRIRKEGRDTHFRVSRARIIGTFDYSAFGTTTKRLRWWAEWLRHHAPNGLKWFLLDYLSSYLTGVDKDGVHAASVAGSYTVSGLDQDTATAIATIDANNRITIAPTTPPTQDADLALGALTAAGGTAADGASLGVSVIVKNLESGAVTTAVDVAFHIALGTALDPSTDPVVGTASLASGIGGSTSQALSGTVTIPASAGSQDARLYAVVDPSGSVTETDETNNTSAAGDAATIIVYDTADASRTYAMLVETFSQSGASSANTVLALYRDDSGTGTFLASVNDTSQHGYAALDTTGTPLAPGTYYALVTSWNSGPYALQVHTANIARATGLTDLANNGADPYEPDNAPHIFPVSQDLSTLPTAYAGIAGAAALDRYAASGDYDWFRFTLP